MISKFKRFQKGVVSWKELLNLGKAASDTNLDKRLANIAINQVFEELYLYLKNCNLYLLICRSTQKCAIPGNCQLYLQTIWNLEQVHSVNA